MKDEKQGKYDNKAYLENEENVSVGKPVTLCSPKFTATGKNGNEPSISLTIASLDLSELEVANEDGSDEDGRDTWDNPIEFLLSCISMSVGLGNVWRFPGVAAKNGGGAFLIPYLCVLLFIGRPLYYMEMCVGQFSRFGQVKIWNMAPIFKGVGYGSITAVICVCSYYCALMAITVYYFFASFSATLPWSVCNEELYGNATCLDPDVDGQLAELYYQLEVFPQLPNINEGLGGIHWKLALCLVASWLIIFVSLVRGVKSSGKVAYFTAIFPYVVLFILLIRGVTLNGAWEGIKYFIKPKWEMLLEPKVWYAAVEQCFFSLGTGFGPVIMFSSYNPFKQNVYKDVLIISILDTFTSLLAGVTVFSVMGYLQVEYNVNMTDAGGPGIIGKIVAWLWQYPQAIATFSWAPQLFSVLFFLMLFTLGLGSATSLAGGIITIICDKYRTWKRWLVTSVVCGCGCLVGLMYVTEGGLFMLDLIDHYGAGFIVYLMAMLECAGIAYIYGLSNFCNDIEFMLGRKTGIYWRLCWAFVIPVGLCANLTYYLITEPEYASSGIPYPKIATTFGWLLTAFAALLIPAWAIHAIATSKAKSFVDKFKEATKPTHRWGPQNSKLRREWLQFKVEKSMQNRKTRYLIF